MARAGSRQRRRQLRHGRGAGTSVWCNPIESVVRSKARQTLDAIADYQGAGSSSTQVVIGYDLSSTIEGEFDPIVTT
jgi:hypothetical protein